MSATQQKGIALSHVLSNDGSPVLALPLKDAPILSCVEGTNADLFPQALALYCTPGAHIADVTYGTGVFWRNVPEGRYDLVPSDLKTGVDFRHLPYADATFDALVLDPPYMAEGGGRGRHASYKEAHDRSSIAKMYQVDTDTRLSHEGLVALYVAGFLEARRVLKRKGILLCKCQAYIGRRQHLTHMHLATILELIGFEVVDEMVLRTTNRPVMRHDFQHHARKNHSYLLVARFIR